MPEELALAIGEIKGITEETKFGAVLGTDIADNPKDLWYFANDGLGGADTKTFPSASSEFFIASDSASDSSVEVTLSAIADDGTLATVVVTATGTTPVSCGTLLDVNRAFLSGDDQSNVGNIAICTANNFTSGFPTTPSQCVAMIPAAYGQTQLSLYRVPIGYKIRIKAVQVFLSRASGGNGSAEVHLRVKPNGGSWRVVRPYELTTSAPLDVKTGGLIFEGGTQLGLRVEDVSDNDTNAFGELIFDQVVI